MEPREIGSRYDAIASRWDESRRKSSQGVDFLERAIKLCPSRLRALDVGCGTGGQLLDKLIASGYSISAVDVSTSMLNIAKGKYPSITFVHDDITNWKPQDRYNLIVAWDSIFHLPHESHAPVIAKLCECLEDQGVLLFTAGGIDSEIVGTMYNLEFAYSSLSDIALIEIVRRCGCVPILMERDQYPLNHLVVLATKARLRA